MKGHMHVLVIPDDPAIEKREIDLPIALIVTYSEEYLARHTELADLTVGKIISHGINEAFIKTMTDEEAGSLLYLATMAGQVDAVRELIRQDVDINERVEYGWTALLAASAQGYPEIAKLLLEVGANPDIGNVHGITPLMYGARYGNEDVCQVLLEYGAALDLKDIYGMTALIIATRDGNQSVVELLITAGADPIAKTNHGETALDFAYACKHGQIAKILRQANKSIQTTK